MLDVEDNGRTLVVEYVGADAVCRGAPKSANPVDRPHPHSLTELLSELDR